MGGQPSTAMLSLLACLLLVCVLPSIGCASSPQVTDAAPALTAEDRAYWEWESRMPTLSVTASQSAAAARDVRPAIVNEMVSDTAWLSVQPDGSLIATGYLDGSLGRSTRQLPGGTIESTYTVSLTVPETVGGVRLLHVLPMVIPDGTSVSVAGKKQTVSALFSDDSSFDPQGNWVAARFSLQDRWIRVDELRYTSTETTWGPWPYDFPATANVDESTAFLDAARPAQPGVPWLDVSQDATAPYVLHGYTGGGVTSSSEPEDGVSASTDVAVPDRLGPVAIYHVVQVFYVKEPRVYGRPESELEDSDRGQVNAFDVWLKGRRLMGD